MDRRDVPRCRTEADITYLGHGVCENHWNQLTADDVSPDALRMALGMPAAPVAAMEEAMEPTTSTSKTSTKPDPEASTPKANKPVKAIKKEKAPAKQKSVKETKPAREKVSAEDVCVFAFRLSVPQRTAIHDAAGGGKASQFVLAAALAAAEGDVEAFKGVVASRASK
jgi:hypothetical protein